MTNLCRYTHTGRVDPAMACIVAPMEASSSKGKRSGLRLAIRRRRAQHASWALAFVAGFLISRWFISCLRPLPLPLQRRNAPEERPASVSVVPAPSPLRPASHVTPLHTSRAATVQRCLSRVRHEYVSTLLKVIDVTAPVMLLDVPNHCNLGDQLIWHGEEIALAAAGIRVAHRCALFESPCGATEVCKKKKLMAAVAAAPGATIIFHGGGNFGDLYPMHRELRNAVMAVFASTRIVFLPQTLYYSPKSGGMVRNDTAAIVRHGGVHLFFRSMASVEAMGHAVADGAAETEAATEAPAGGRSNQEDAEVTRTAWQWTLAARTPPGTTYQSGFGYSLQVDSAFMVPLFTMPCVPTVDVLYMRRGDHESIVSPEAGIEFLGALQALGLTVRVTDWSLTPTEAGAEATPWTRKSRPVTTAAKPPPEAASAAHVSVGHRIVCCGRVLVSDRVHAAVYAILSGRPVVALDSISNKTEGVFGSLHAVGGGACAPDALGVKLIQANRLVQDGVAAVLAALGREGPAAE